MNTLFSLVISLLIVFSAQAASTASLRGSHASMEAQNREAERSSLSHIDDDAALERMKKNGFLVPIPESVALVVDYRLEEKWRYVRPWTAKFLTDISRDFHKTFGEPLQVNSAVRTVERQAELRRVNGNAAAKTGARRSVHPTGAAIDLAKLGRTGPQIKWLASRLLKLEEQGLIEATSEHRQLVFHIMVFKKYGQRPLPKKQERN